jgi:hypothetical protein
MKIRTLLAIVAVSCFAWSVSTASAGGSQSSLEPSSLRLVPELQPNVSTGPIIVPPAPKPGG